MLSQAAWAQEAPPPPGGFGILLPMIAIMVLMYFLILRPQAKRAKEHASMVQALSKGDEVVTNGGILGRIEKVEEQFLTLKIAANTAIRIQKHTVGAVMPKGTYKD
ncbi:MAG: preprotein translocase subunit YajC [Pseudomonadota bacterium]